MEGGEWGGGTGKPLLIYWKVLLQFAWYLLWSGFYSYVISDFPSKDIKTIYSTKRKSVQSSSDSSLKLISYSSIFASNF